MRPFVCVLAGLLLSLAGDSGRCLAQDPLVLKGAQVLDENGASFREGVMVALSDGRIAAITEGSAEGTTLELEGLHLIPGLIDLHTHLVLYPYDQRSWDDQVMRESVELRTIRGVIGARKTLLSGFTTIRELGTEGAGFADTALRDAVNLGLISGPRILAATRAIVATGCYGPSGFAPRWDLPKGAQVADGVDGVRKAVREQVAAGADWIKVYADYRRVRGGPSTPTFSQEELTAIVDEARSAGRPVASHAATDEAIRRSVMAGVKTIEHGYGASEESLRLMKQHGVVLCPTLAASEAIARYTGWSPGEPDSIRIKTARELMKRALRSGVTIACGSDAGVFAHGTNAKEIELMVEYGMTPEQALEAATRTAAAVLSLENEVGKIRAGFKADLVAVEGDPLQDISALRRVKVVIQGGRIVVDRRNEDR